MWKAISGRRDVVVVRKRMHPTLFCNPDIATDTKACAKLDALETYQTTLDGAMTVPEYSTWRKHSGSLQADCYVLHDTQALLQVC